MWLPKSSPPGGGYFIREGRFIWRGAIFGGVTR